MINTALNVLEKPEDEFVIVNGYSNGVVNGYSSLI